MISIGAVLPFLGLLTSPEKVFTHEITRPLIEILNVSGPNQLLAYITIVFMMAALCSGGAKVALLWAQTRLSYAIGADIGIGIYRRTLYQPYKVHCVRNSSEVISGIANKANLVVAYIIMPVLTMLNATLLTAAVLSTFLLIEAKIAIITISAAGVFYVFITTVNKKGILKWGKQISKNSDQVIKIIQESLGGIRNVLLDATQEYFCDEFKRKDQIIRKAKANIQIISTYPRYALETFCLLIIAGVAYSFADRPDGIKESIPVLGALALGVQRLIPVLQQAYSSQTQIRAGLNILTDTLELLDQQTPKTNLLEAKILPFNKSIEIRNLCFRHGRTTPWILNNISLTIDKGSRLGFIGSTGSGKSTLMDIVMALVEPTAGSIKVDGVDIFPERKHSWQLHIAHVPQTIFLSDSTILQNIAFGVPYAEIDFDRVREAATKAHIAEEIESWDGGYETLVGEGGVRLSGGQRQRIGIARALYKRADVIIFDEATSALDSATEELVMKAIGDIDDDITVLIIAHRLTTLKKCTKIYTITAGVIDKVETYKELLINSEMSNNRESALKSLTKPS